MNGQFPHDSVQPQVSEVFTCLPGFTGFDQALPQHIYVAWHHKKGLFPVSYQKANSKIKILRKKAK